MFVAAAASNASVVSVGPPSPTASVDLDKQQPTSPIGVDTMGGSPSLQQASSMAWRSSHNISRTRMLELFSRVTGSNGGTSEAALFNGLRVRMVGRCLVGLGYGCSVKGLECMRDSGGYDQAQALTDCLARQRVVATMLLMLMLCAGHRDGCC